MKRILSFVLTFLILCSLATPAFASQLSGGNDVVAKYNITYEGEYRANVAGGTATAGGITVTGAPANAVTLVVIPMEGDALSWVDGCVDGSALAAYDIHFLDAEGNRINANGAKVSVTVSGSSLIVSSVTTAGTDKVLTSEMSGGKASFTADGSHYYVIAQKQTEDDHHTKVEVENFGADDITEDLKEVGYDTVAEIETALRVIINEQNCDLDADNTALYDVVLMYSTDGGQTWTRADEEHFPEDGKLLISLGVPAGTSTATHDYYVVHMFSKDAFGKKAGDVEYPAVTERDGHIEFYVTGLSPILVGWTDTSSTAPGGHSFTNKASNVKATDATCTEAATYYVQCDNCTEHTTEKTVPVGEPLGHDWDEGTVTTKPTCEKDGIRTFTCKRDNTHTDTKAEPATGHSFTKYESNNDATCKKDGTETAKCDHGCGKTDTRTDKGSKLGHKYEDGKCVRCGLSWWSPETGDKIMIAVVTLIVSGAALLLLFAWKKKKRKQ